MDTNAVIEALQSTASLISARHAGTLVPVRPGVYAIIVDDASSLPCPFSDILLDRDSRVLYVGKASNSLLRCLVDEDLRGRSNSTFFRGIGAILGYRPPAGSLVGKSNQNNYKFSPKDALELVEWINGHLSVRWVCLPEQVAVEVEPEVIKSLSPLINTTYNPRPVQELAYLRDECRRVARSKD